MSLEFLGSEWKDAYINFIPVTIKDLEEQFPALAKMDRADAKSLDKGFETVMSLLSQKFIDGKGVDSEGNLIDIGKEDLKDFPAEVISRAFSFLSQDISVTTPKP